MKGVGFHCNCSVALGLFLKRDERQQISELFGSCLLYSTSLYLESADIVHFTCPLKNAQRVRSIVLRKISQNKRQDPNTTDGRS